MIDARSMGKLVDRTRRELSDVEVTKISKCYRAWRQSDDPHAYRDVPGFCKSVTIADIEKHKGALVPGRFVGFDRTDLSDDRLHYLQSEFAEIRHALSTISDELQESIDCVEHAFNG